MTKPILIVEDDEMQRQMLATLLQRKLSFHSHLAEHGRAALDILEADEGKTIKLVILDVQMPVMGGIETLEIIRQRYPALPVIMLTGSQDISDAVDAMKLGATDFLTKPYAGDRMMITVKNALKLSLLSKEVSRLQREKEGTFTFENLIGHDSGLSAVVNIGRKAAAADIPVLITGETGTGKEVFARAIHGESDRGGKPFIAVNCGAIPAQLVESTLFGHEKGSFTGATAKAIGKFREAEGGTIFLDEVGELPRDTQVKLLRVLQQREVEPVGAGKAEPINVRVISATNRNLQREVDEDRFREDLFFRLNVLQIELSALRTRKEDILTLAHHFIERFCVNEGGMPKDISSDLKAKLQNHDWPGNVRQLENTINRAMVISEGNELCLDDFNVIFASGDAPTFTDAGTSAGTNASAAQSQHNICVISADGHIKTATEIEQEAITIVLKHHDGNITQAAKSIGMAKSTFYKKIKDT